MKSFFSLAVLSLLWCANPALAQSKNIQKTVVQTSITCDHCKACGSCGKNLQAGLFKIKGLKTFEIDEDTKQITVYYDRRKTSIETIRERIASLGFNADDVKATPEAIAALANCCKP